MLRQMRANAPRTAQVIDEMIRNIPHIRNEPVRIVVPETQQEQQGRLYLAGLPPIYDAPVVIYRQLQPNESPRGEWLVTALINRGEYEAYRRAERSGILDDPAVRDFTARLGGTVATIVNSNPEPGDDVHGVDLR